MAGACESLMVYEWVRVERSRMVVSSRVVCVCLCVDFMICLSINRI